MEEFENLMNNIGEINLNGQNLGDVGSKTLMHISDDEYVDVVYDICKCFRDLDETNAKNYREGVSREIDLDKAKFFQDRADKISKLIQDEKMYKEKVKRLLTFLENLYLSSNKKSIDEEITPFPVENGKVQIPDESVTHATSLSQMAGISKGGLLASEWFGELESENEGRFCCFLSKVSQISGGARSRRGIANLYFDTNSPISRLLFSMDFFAYEKVKANNPDYVEKMFLPEVIDLFETIIEPLSPGGINMYKFSRTNSWVAIPGGIPSQLVKGIMLSSKEEKLDELVENCSLFFPKAVIFDETYTVLGMPKLISESDDKKIR